MNRDRMKLGYLVKEIPYYTSDYHSLIGIEERNGFVSLDNIGDDGSNLTIAVLSMNRAYLTIRLMESVKNCLGCFKGEFLIGDNGSSEEEKLKLRAYMKKMPFNCRMIEFNTNYGVAGGRNRLFSEAMTDWIFSLDNDIYFTSNPLKKIQYDINALGVKFLVMPLKDKNDKNGGIFGSNLYVENKNSKCSVGLGSAFIVNDLEMDTEEEGFLCTALPGTAVLNKHTFFEVGGYESEENMFVGFEDTEFSIRIFQKGYKIGCCGTTCLYHDHPAPEQLNDIDYEKKRFSSQKLFESAKYFEQKAGFHVWDDATKNWINDRRKTIGIRDGKDTACAKSQILLVVDRPEWALDHIAIELQNNLSEKYNFKIIYGIDIDNVVDVFLLGEECDIIHFFWRGHLSTYWDDYSQNRIKSLGFTAESFYDRYIKGKVVSTEVYDHLCLDDTESIITQKLFYDKRTILTNYAVSSKKLWDIYNSLADIRLKPDAVIEDGVNLDIFYPQNLERFNHTDNRTLRFGWVGNSKWFAGDIKGIKTIIEPAINSLIEQGYNIELITSDREERFIPHTEMVDFYKNIDCYLCASLCEGTPNPVLEAMACGVPVISTDVGLVPEVFGERQKKYILVERSIASLIEKIKEIISDENGFKELSSENLIRIQEWSWKKRVKNFEIWFDNCLTM